MCGNHPELRQRTAPVSCQNPGAKAQMTNETGRSAKQTAAVARLSPQPPLHLPTFLVMQSRHSLSANIVMFSLSA